MVSFLMLPLLDNYIELSIHYIIQPYVKKQKQKQKEKENHRNKSMKAKVS